MAEQSPLPSTENVPSGQAFFQPLPTARSIRLVDVRFESDRQDRLQTQYQTVSLDENPRYTALSYTWGVKSQNDLGLMEKAGITMTENLYSALVHAALSHPGLYWIDALCINQKDDEEKSKQVALMREIYSSAMRVMVNLGPPSSNDELACNLMITLCELYQTDKLGFTATGFSLSIPLAQKYPFEDKKLLELGLPPTDAEDWLALASLLSRPYFERVWVVQELVVSSAPIVVVCGSFRLSWEMFEILNRCLLPLGWNKAIKHLALEQNKELPLQAVDFAVNVEVLRYQREDKSRLETLLDMSRSLRATDPRDKIIALLGMVKEGEEGKAAVYIPPDYGKSVQETYTDVTGAFIVSGSLELLSSVECKATTEIEHLPSWVPDYSSIGHNGSFAAGYEAAGDTSVSATWSPGSQELRINGQIVDTVAVVSSSAGGEDGNDFLMESFKMAASILGSGDEHTWLSHLISGRSEPALDAFWRTMIGDKDDQSACPAPKEVRNHFALYMFKLFAEDGLKISEEDGEILKSNPYFQNLLRSGDILHFMTLWYDKIQNHRFFITEKSRVGLASLDVEKGDKVAIFSGGCPIYIVRGSMGHFKFIGDGYVHGLMHGEAFSEEGSRFEQFTLR